jgi:hypothetical protein
MLTTLGTDGQAIGSKTRFEATEAAFSSTQSIEVSIRK